jgi:putative SOS response-associated peptidase YedK
LASCFPTGGQITTNSHFTDWISSRRTELQILVLTDGFYEWKKLDPKGKGSSSSRLQWPKA